MTPLTSLLRYVYPLAATAAEPAVINALRSAAIELCDRSHIWVDTLDRVSLLANKAEYELEPPPQARVAQIQRITISGQEIRPRSHAELDKMFPDTEWLLIAGMPAYFTQFDDSFIRLVPYPTVSARNAMVIRTSLSPTEDATSITDMLFTNYGQDIAYGAAARLLREQDRTYEDKNMSVYYRRLFDQAVTSAKINANRSLTKTSLRVANVRI